MFVQSFGRAGFRPFAVDAGEDAGRGKMLAVELESARPFHLDARDIPGGDGGTIPFPYAVDIGAVVVFLQLFDGDPEAAVEPGGVGDEAHVGGRLESTGNGFLD